MTRVLVVDDSALMRRKLREILERGGFEVVHARNGQDALEQIDSVDPDVVTLDINMPEMDGLTCLSHIMTASPRPVLMVSSITAKGAVATFEALELGAVDYVTKPGGTVSVDMSRAEQELLDKVAAAAGVGPSGARSVRAPGARAATGQVAAEPPPAAPAEGSGPARRTEALVIGVSTGGPRTLEKILPRLPASFPAPVVVVQHMPATFTEVFAERLNKRCALPVSEVRRPTVLADGTIHIARGDADIVFSRRARGLSLVPVPVDDTYPWHPCVDRLLESARDYFAPAGLLGVLLTGMGNDGAEQLAAWHRDGARTIAESQESAVVFGMPQELARRGGASLVLHADAVAEQILKWVDDGGRHAAGAR